MQAAADVAAAAADKLFAAIQDATDKGDMAALQKAAEAALKAADALSASAAKAGTGGGDAQRAVVAGAVAAAEALRDAAKDALEEAAESAKVMRALLAFETTAKSKRMGFRVSLISLIASMHCRGPFISCDPSGSACSHRRRCAKAGVQS